MSNVLKKRKEMTGTEKRLSSLYPLFWAHGESGDKKNEQRGHFKKRLCQKIYQSNSKFNSNGWNWLIFVIGKLRI